MNRNKKNLHRVTINALGITLASLVAAGPVAETVMPVSVYAAQPSGSETNKNIDSKVVYLDGGLKEVSEKADGSTKENAVNTLQRAVKLAGEKGTILVCRTVEISQKTDLVIPSGVEIKRAEGFEGSLIKIVGDGELRITKGKIKKSDIDTSQAKKGDLAFSEEEIKEVEKAKDIVVPSQITLETPEEWLDFDFGAAGFQGDGSFSWKSQSAPSIYQSEVQIVFMPKDAVNYDYSQIPGWNQENKTVVRSVTVTIESLKPQEEEPIKEKTPGSVTIPEQIVLKTPEEWAGFDFAAAGFQGNGSFAWEDGSTPSVYESEKNLIFTPSDTENVDYSQISGWEEESSTVTRSVKIQIESLKSQEEKPENPDTGKDKEEPEADTPDNTVDEGSTQNQGENKEESLENGQDSQKPAAEPGKTGEVAEEIPEAIPVGSLIDDQTGIFVEGDFIPFYVDLLVWENDGSQLPDAGIGEVLSSYEIKLWDLKEDKEYEIPEGKTVKVMMPIPESAEGFDKLSIAHYLASNEYEHFSLAMGNMKIEERNGIQYLSFETKSFSPFNVGGEQIVGPGSKKEPANSQTGNTGNSSVKIPGSGQNLTPPAGSNIINNGNTNTKKTDTKIIRTVKTGDESPILLYIGIGAAAVILAIIALIFGKKKK